MFELTGKHNTCKVFTDMTDNTTISQLTTLLNQPFVKDSKIRIMPDTHAGAGCVIGTTMTLKDKVVSNLVGCDIGCGMLTVQLQERPYQIDPEKLDKMIRKFVPAGFNVHETAKHATPLNCDDLFCKNSVNSLLAYRSVGTLGGGEVLATGRINSPA